MKEKDVLYYISVFSGTGTLMLLIIVLSLFSGLYLDKVFNTGYVFSLSMTVFGMFISVFWIFSRIKKLIIIPNKDNDNT